MTKQEIQQSLSLHNLTLAELESRFEDNFDNYPDYKPLRDTYEFARSAHGSQTRQHNESIPYIVHPLRIIMRMFTIYKIKDLVLLKSALLHDTVEDTAVKLSEIQDKFGERVAFYVKALTRERPADEDEHPNAKYAAKIAKLQQYLKSSFKVRLLKAHDLIDNMQDWPLISKQSNLTAKFPRWLNEAENYYMPLVESLGPNYVIPVRNAIDKMYKMGYKATSSDFKA